MAKIKARKDVKLFAGILFHDEKILKNAEDKLTALFGPIDFRSAAIDFDFTEYYSREMGAGLKKYFISFLNLIPREKLAEIKNLTNEIEEQFSIHGKRTVNIDSGYITEHNIVLGSMKEMPHRIYISEGVFGDAVLAYKNKEYVDFTHTFPDFKTAVVKEILKKIRGIYAAQLKNP